MAFGRNKEIIKHEAGIALDIVFFRPVFTKYLLVSESDLYF
jgi:hypothetical protein